MDHDGLQARLTVLGQPLCTRGVALVPERRETIRTLVLITRITPLSVLEQTLCPLGNPLVSEHLEAIRALVRIGTIRDLVRVAEVLMKPI